MAAIIALDLGTKTGWATTQAGIITGGWESFATKPPHHPGKRFELFYSWLRHGMDGKDIEAIYYEEVRRHNATQAAHIYGALKGLLLKFACHRHISVYGLEVGEVKKFWTGKGNASKELMIKSAHEQGFNYVCDDNHADALAILHYALAKRAINA